MSLLSQWVVGHRAMRPIVEWIPGRNRGAHGKIYLCRVRNSGSRIRNKTAHEAR